MAESLLAAEGSTSDPTSVAREASLTTHSGEDASLTIRYHNEAWSDGYDVGPDGL